MYYDYMFSLDPHGNQVELRVDRYRPDPENSAIWSLSINPEALTTQTNVRRSAQSQARYHLTIMQNKRARSQVYLLLGDTALSKLRIFFIPYDHPPELKLLDLSWHDMIMDIDEFSANRDANPINDADSDDKNDVIPRNYNRKTEVLSVPLRSKDSHAQRDTAETASSSQW